MIEDVTIGGRFAVESEVGSGGMGTVFRGRDLETGRLVALKLLNEGLDRERFAREAELLARLDGEHVVGYVTHADEPGERPYLVMEWIDGRNLRDRLSDLGLTTRESVDLAMALARGLSVAHRLGVVHRDVKPSNVLLPGDDPARARIADFGLGRADDQTSLTRTGAVLGTPGYMAPEQALARPPIDSRADLFALGAILYECLSGRPAFSGLNALAVHCKVVAFEPPPVSAFCPRVPAALSNLCERLLAKDVASRPPDAEAVLEALALIDVAPGGPRRSTRASEAATAVATVESTPRAQFVIMASAPLTDDGLPAEVEPGSLAAIESACLAAGVELVAIGAGEWLVAVADPDAALGARRAARLARAIAVELAGAIVVINGADASRDSSVLDTVIDEGSVAFDLGIREALFGADRPVGAIRLDDFTAAALAGREPSRTPASERLDEQIVEIDGIAYLLEMAS